MTESSFTTVYSNNLEQVQMIAGDTQTFVYNVYNTDGTSLSLTSACCTLFVFKYGDPTTVIAQISGSIVTSGSVDNQFSATFSGSALSGVYQQQIKIIDAHGNTHIPAQGKIIIFPSPAS
jgi:hypothetical protein